MIGHSSHYIGYAAGPEVQSCSRVGGSLCWAPTNAPPTVKMDINLSYCFQPC